MKCSEFKNLQSHLKVRPSKEYPWKVLFSLVEDHRHCLNSDELEVIRQIVRKRDYDGYLSLSQAWGPQSITPSELATKENFRAKYQVASLLKKFRFPSGNSARKEAALKKFQAAESICKDFNEVGYKCLVDLQDRDELRAFTYARSFLRRVLGAELPSHEQLTMWSRHGPGANLDTKMGLTSLYHKYSEWPYSCTSDAYWHARHAICADERWLGALEDDYRTRHDVPKTAILDQDMFWANVLNVVEGNRITFVPKNSQTDRSIAIEPSLNLYLQLGVDGYIRRRLKRWGVDLDDQTKNQRLALEGSRAWRSPDPYVTLDLAAASDTVSLKLCEIMLPPSWNCYLRELRSPKGNLEGSTLQYEKISSMGNGYTFALESAIFASLAYGVMRVVRGSFDRNEMAIYGDDIIVRSSCAGLMVKMLTVCGFSINPEKSFFEGPFRESCGADWYNGESVRPVFLTTQPSTVMELWNDANRLQRLMERHQLMWENQTCKLIDRWIPEVFKEFVGPYSDTEFDSYRHVPLPQGKYRNGLWKFNRVVVVPKRLNVGHNFLFRKLMSPLRQAG